MRTNTLLLMAVALACGFNFYLFTHVPFNYYQIRALVFAEFMLLGVFGWLLFQVVQRPKNRIVEWKGERFEVVKNGVCTDCHFFKNCHSLQEPQVANDFMDATGVNCMLDAVSFKKLPKNYGFKGEMVQTVPATNYDYNCGKCCFIEVCTDKAVLEFEALNGLDCETQNHYYTIVNQ